MIDLKECFKDIEAESRLMAMIGQQQTDGFMVHSIMPIRGYNEYEGFEECYEQRLDIVPNIFYDMTLNQKAQGKFLHKYSIFFHAKNITALMFYWSRGDTGCWFITHDKVLLNNDTSWLTKMPTFLPCLSSSKEYGLVGASSPGNHSKVNQPVIFIGSRSNYYHFVIDFLPYLILANQNPNLTKLPFLFQIQTSYQSEFLALLGIPHERQLFMLASENSTVIADIDDVLLPSPLPLPVRVELVRNKFSLAKNDTGHRKIFIGRRMMFGAARRITNEDQVIAFLQPFGFQIVYLEEYSVREQIELFSDAACIIAAHGAALVNMCFAPKKCALIELMNNLCESHESGIFDCYKKISHCIGLDYYRLVFEAQPNSVNTKNVQEAAFLCDLDRLEMTIGGIFGR